MEITHIVKICGKRYCVALAFLIETQAISTAAVIINVPPSHGYTKNQLIKHKGNFTENKNSSRNSFYQSQSKTREDQWRY